MGGDGRGGDGRGGEGRGKRDICGDDLELLLERGDFIRGLQRQKRLPLERVHSHRRHHHLAISFDNLYK